MVFAAPVKPKLAVVLVFDQFRADYLTRFESRFLPAKGKNGMVGGFKYLMENGAYFPLAEHSNFQNMTCPGHAAILTGSYPYQNGITINDWYDNESQSPVYCVEDAKAPLVGIPTKDVRAGRSPRLMSGTTVGDELKNGGWKSKVAAVALKDRAAILLGGHRADLALWFDLDSFQWVSSRFYLRDGKLPAWVDKLNLNVAADKNKLIKWTALGLGTGRSEDGNVSVEKKFSESIGANFPHETKIGTEESLLFPYGVEKTFDAAIAAQAGMKLGSGPDTDVLAVSISTHDFVGHVYGPNSREIEELTIAEDQQVARFLNYLNKAIPGGLKQTLVIMTADHGAGPVPALLNANGIDAGVLDDAEIAKDLNQMLEKKYKSPPSGNWVTAVHDLNIYLNTSAVSERKLDVNGMANDIVEHLSTSKKWKGIAFAFSSEDVRNRRLPTGIHERSILNSYVKGRSGDVVAMPKPFYIVGKNAATHFTDYSYDRYVPLIFLGERFKKGIYRKKTEIVDIAPTLAQILGTIPPSGSEGRVLDEILK